MASDDEDETRCVQNMRQLAAEFAACQPFFAALGDPIRQHIILILLSGEADGMRVGAIAAQVDLSRPAVSHHLRVLLDAGLVSLRRKGTRNYYQADYRVSVDQLEALLRHIRSIQEQVGEIQQR